MKPETIKSKFFLYSDDLSHVFRQKNVKTTTTTTTTKLIEDFSRISDWFVNDKLSIHCGDDKTKSIIFDLIS